MREKYDVVFDWSNCRWVSARGGAIVKILEEFLKEFSEKHSRKPVVVGVTMGVDVWKHVRFAAGYDWDKQILTVYDVEIPVSLDWSCNPDYLELNLE